jgi:hypothetical protein
MINRDINNLEQNFKRKIEAFLQEAQKKYPNVVVFE